MELGELQVAVTQLQAVGLQFSDLKQQISDVVTAQQSNRDALLALKGDVQGAERWVQRPGGVWLRLPADQAERVVRAEGRDLGVRLEALFGEQMLVIAQLEAEGLAPEHFAALTGGRSSSSSKR